jgi:hypothetical protein
MAAADGLSLYVAALGSERVLPEACDARILCEVHEDWVVMWRGAAELVSAKHRESSTGTWKTMNELVGRGGLAHLYNRWTTLDRKPRVRMVTSLELAAGPPRQLARATEFLRAQARGVTIGAAGIETIAAAVSSFAAEHQNRVPKQRKNALPAVAPGLSPDDFQEDVRRFLAALIIQDDRPSRAFTAHAAPSMYAQPVHPVSLPNTTARPPARSPSPPCGASHGFPPSLGRHRQLIGCAGQSGHWPSCGAGHRYGGKSMTRA